jgi:hypothetical protein
MHWNDLNLYTKTRKWVWWYINRLIENCIWLKDNGGGGSGDMTRAIYDTDNDSIVDAAETVTDGTTANTSTAEEIRDTIDTVDALSILDRIGFLEGYFKNDTPAVWGDRLLLLVGQVVTISSYQDLCDAVYCGDVDNATASCFYKTSDAGGTTRSTSGTYMVMPDARGLSFKGLGNAIINGRTKIGPTELGEAQEDQVQAWQLGVDEDDSGAREYWAVSSYRDYTQTFVSAIGWTPVYVNTMAQGDSQMYKAKNDGTHGNIRSGDNNRDNTIGTNWGIGY